MLFLSQSLCPFAMWCQSHKDRGGNSAFTGVNLLRELDVRLFSYLCHSHWPNFWLLIKPKETTYKQKEPNITA